MTEVGAAARRWAKTWRQAWPAKDVEALAALYAGDALYRALAFREPDRGLGGVRRYLSENFAVEEELECWFGDPIAYDDRAAVQWWGSWVEEGRRLSMAGTSILRFDKDGLVTDQRDYWNEVDGRVPPYAGW